MGRRQLPVRSLAVKFGAYSDKCKSVVCELAHTYRVHNRRDNSPAVLSELPAGWIPDWLPVILVTHGTWARSFKDSTLWDRMSSSSSVHLMMICWAALSTSLVAQRRLD